MITKTVLTQISTQQKKKMKTKTKQRNKQKKQRDYVFHSFWAKSTGELAWSQSRNTCRYIVPGLASVVPQSQLHKCVKTAKLISFLPHNQGK